MSNVHRRTPRRSILEGRHPAIPQESTPKTDTKPVMPATDTTGPIPAQPRRQKMTVNVTSDLVDQAKDAFWVARGEYRSFAAWIEEALRRQIEATRVAHSLDELPPRPRAELPTGRPVG